MPESGGDVQPHKDEEHIAERLVHFLERMRERAIGSE
jgi:hypothetical protein